MLTRLRTDTASVWRRGWVKIGVGVLAGAAVGGGVVYADGGDAAQVHACVNSADEGRPNVIIVDPNDGCPSGYSSRHWSIQGPKGDPGPSAHESPLQGTPSDLDAFVDRIGALRGPTLKEVTTSSLADGTDGKVVDAKCPKSHRRVVAGTFQAKMIEVGEFGASVTPISVIPVYNGPIPQGNKANRWRVAAWVGGEINWVLYVTAFCQKATPSRSG